MPMIGVNRSTIQPFGLALTLAAALPAVAQVPTWQLTGPEGGSILEIAASSRVMLASTSGGLYRSTDQAANWQRVPAIGSSQSIAASPHDPDVVVVASGTSLWRSVDGGTSWDSVAVGVRLNALQFNPIAAHQAELLAIASDQQEWWRAPRLMRSVDRGSSWQSVASDPAFEPLGFTIDRRDGTYFSLLRDGRLMFSSNRGARWDLLLSNPDTSASYLSPMLIASGGAQTALLWTSNGGWASTVLRYDNLDVSWVWSASGPTRGLFADPQQSHRLWAASTGELGDERLGESLDLGATWTLLPSDHNARLQTVMADGTMIGSSMAGPLISTDAGRHWSVRARGIPLAHVNALAGHRADGSLIAVTKAGAWVSADHGMTWQAGAGIAATTLELSSVGRHPRDPAIALASVYGTSVAPRTYHTADGGLHWQPLAADSGLSNGSLSSIVYDAADPSRISATSSNQVFWSQDGGQHWQLIQGGVETLRAAADGTSSRLYGLARWNPGYALLRADRSGAVMTAIDTAPMLGALAVHPTAPHVLLATGAGSGPLSVRLSTDGGDSWQPRGELPGDSVNLLLAFDACDARTVYALASGTFLRSHDLGRSWTVEPLDQPVQGASAIDTRCVGGLSHVALSSNLTGGVRVRSPVATDRIATNDLDPL